MVGLAAASSSGSRPSSTNAAVDRSALYAGLSPSSMEQAAVVNALFSVMSSSSQPPIPAHALPSTSSLSTVLPESRSRGATMQPGRVEEGGRVLRRLRPRRSKDRGQPIDAIGGADGEISRGGRGEIGMAFDTPNSSPVRSSRRSRSPRKVAPSSLHHASASLLGGPSVSTATATADDLGASVAGMFSPLTSMFAETGLDGKSFPWPSAPFDPSVPVAGGGGSAGAGGGQGFDFGMPFAEASPVPSPSRARFLRAQSSSSNLSPVSVASSDASADHGRGEEEGQPSGKRARSAVPSGTGEQRLDDELARQYEQYLWSSPQVPGKSGSGASVSGGGGRSGKGGGHVRGRSSVVAVNAGNMAAASGVGAAMSQASTQLAELQSRLAPGTTAALRDWLVAPEYHQCIPTSRPALALGPSLMQFSSSSAMSPGLENSAVLAPPLMPSASNSSISFNGSSKTMSSSQPGLKRGLKRRRNVSEQMDPSKQPTSNEPPSKPQPQYNTQERTNEQDISDESQLSFHNTAEGTLQFAFDSPGQSPASSVSSYGGPELESSTQSLPDVPSMNGQLQQQQFQQWQSMGSVASQAAYGGTLAYLDVAAPSGTVGPQPLQRPQQQQQREQQLRTGQPHLSTSMVLQPIPTRSTRPLSHASSSSSRSMPDGRGQSPASESPSLRSSPGAEGAGHDPPDTAFANQSPKAMRGPKARKEMKGPDSYHLAPLPPMIGSTAVRRASFEDQRPQRFAEQFLPQQSVTTMQPQQHRTPHVQQQHRHSMASKVSRDSMPMSYLERSHSAEMVAAQQQHDDGLRGKAYGQSVSAHPRGYNATPPHPPRAPLRRALTMSDGFPLPPTPESLPHNRGGGQRLEQQAIMRRINDHGGSVGLGGATHISRSWHESPTVQSQHHLRPPQAPRSRGCASDQSSMSPASSHLPSASPSPQQSPASHNPGYQLPSPLASPVNTGANGKISLREALRALDDLTGYLSEQSVLEENTGAEGFHLATREHFFTLGELRGRIRRRLEVEEQRRYNNR